MSRKPSYSGLALTLTEETPRDPVATPPSGDTLKEISHHVMVYTSPECAKALARYALEQSGFRKRVRVHDLWIEAMEDWTRKHGLNVKVRAK